MKVTILGCGSSGGVPLIGNNWGNCDPANPYNRRMRPSILIENNDDTILIDTSPDMRQQLLACNLQKLTAVIYTHSHADHCHGIDDLRSVNWLTRQPIEVYSNKLTLDQIQQRFSYIFKSDDPNVFYTPSINLHAVDGPFTIGTTPIIPFEQDHGHVVSLGFRIGDFAYSTDVKHLDKAAFDCMAGIKAWVVDCVRELPHPKHSHLEQTLMWIDRVKPDRAVLTHMNETLDYATLWAKLPQGVVPAHDGMVIEC